MIDWGAVFSPITGDMGSYVQSALVGIMALVAAPVLIKGGVAVAAYAARQIQRIFG